MFEGVDCPPQNRKTMGEILRGRKQARPPTSLQVATSKTSSPLTRDDDDDDSILGDPKLVIQIELLGGVFRTTVPFPTVAGSRPACSRDSWERLGSSEHAPEPFNLNHGSGIPNMQPSSPSRVGARPPANVEGIFGRGTAVVNTPSSDFI